MTLLIIDADHISHRAAASCQPTKAKSYQEEEHVALSRAKGIIEGLAYTYNNPTMEFYIAGENNWRKEFYPEYKANRAQQERPAHLDAVREMLVTEYSASVVNDMEVDDMCGIRMTQEEWQYKELQDYRGKVVCVSLDKDLLQVPGYHYSWEISGTTSTGTKWVKPAQEILVSPLDGLRRFYKQVVLGDQSDNIPGFDGKFRSSMPKFIQALVEPIDYMTEEIDMYQHCAKLYLEAGNSTDNMVRNAKLLYVMRKHDERWTIP